MRLAQSERQAEHERAKMRDGEVDAQAMPTAAAAPVPAPFPSSLQPPAPPPPGTVLSEAATALIASNKAKRRALGASLESLLATFSSGNGNGNGDVDASASASPLLLDMRFAPLVRRAREQRAALFALSRGVPLSAGLMAAVDGVEVVAVDDGGDGDDVEPYFYSEPVKSLVFFAYFLCFSSA